jgi:hypothetical protein
VGHLARDAVFFAALSNIGGKVAELCAIAPPTVWRYPRGSAKREGCACKNATAQALAGNGVVFERYDNITSRIGFRSTLYPHPRRRDSDCW